MRTEVIEACHRAYTEKLAQSNSAWGQALLEEMGAREPTKFTDSLRENSPYLASGAAGSSVMAPMLLPSSDEAYKMNQSHYDDLARRANWTGQYRQRPLNLGTPHGFLSELRWRGKLPSPRVKRFVDRLGNLQSSYKPATQEVFSGYGTKPSLGVMAHELGHHQQFKSWGKGRQATALASTKLNYPRLLALLGSAEIPEEYRQTIMNLGAATAIPLFAMEFDASRRGAKLLKASPAPLSALRRRLGPYGGLASYAAIPGAMVAAPSIMKLFGGQQAQDREIARQRIDAFKKRMGW